MVLLLIGRIKERRKEMDNYIQFKDYPEIVSPKQIASMLHIGICSVYELLKEGEIHSKQIGKKYIIPKQAVIDYLNSS